MGNGGDADFFFNDFCRKKGRDAGAGPGTVRQIDGIDAVVFALLGIGKEFCHVKSRRRSQLHGTDEFPFGQFGAQRTSFADRQREGQFSISFFDRNFYFFTPCKRFDGGADGVDQFRADAAAAPHGGGAQTGETDGVGAQILFTCHVKASAVHISGSSGIGLQDEGQTGHLRQRFKLLQNRFRAAAAVDAQCGGGIFSSFFVNGVKKLFLVPHQRGVGGKTQHIDQIREFSDSFKHAGQIVKGAHGFKDDEISFQQKGELLGDDIGFAPGVGVGIRFPRRAHGSGDEGFPVGGAPCQFHTGTVDGFHLLHDAVPAQVPGVGIEGIGGQDFGTCAQVGFVDLCDNSGTGQIELFVRVVDEKVSLVQFTSHGAVKDHDTAVQFFTQYVQGKFTPFFIYIHSRDNITAESENCKLKNKEKRQFQKNLKSPQKPAGPASLFPVRALSRKTL